MGKKLKSENMQKRAVFSMWSGGGVMAGVENGAMLTTFIQIYFRMVYLWYLLFKACNHVRTYRRGPKCQKHPVAKAAFHVRGKLSRSKGQIRSNFAALLL